MSRIAIVVGLLAFLAGLFAATFAKLSVFLPALLKGLLVTVQISVLSWFLFISLSFLTGIGRSHGPKITRWLCVIYIEVFRGTSLLVILFWLFFVMPEFGVMLSPILAGVLGIGLNFGAYGAEIVRGAIGAVPKGQIETTIALNMTDSWRMRRIILPQAITIMIPSMVNLTIEMIKATALVSAITLTDITYAAVQQNQLHFRTVEIFALTLILYYCLAQLIRVSGAALEEHFSRHLSKEV